MSNVSQSPCELFPTVHGVVSLQRVQGKKNAGDGLRGWPRANRLSWCH